MGSPVDRRRFLVGMAATAALVACSDDQTALTPGTSADPATTSSAPTTAAPAPARPVSPIESPSVTLAADPFANGVGSGDPTVDSVVLWTRLLAPELDPEVPVVWEVAVDDRFETLVVTELATVTAGDAHSLRAVAVGLSAGASYWYRFRVGDFTSPVGRTRTLGGPGAGDERLRLAVTSCQRWEDGHFAAHRDIARADVDLVVWLGDFIYGPRSPGEAVDGRSLPGAEPITLADYRDRYRRYRSDPLLQEAQAAHPWVSTWDDHELADDYDASADPERRAAAYRAWWEHTPTRLPRPDDDELVVHRSVDVGDLARICLVDVRQYADDTTLLGDDQRRWLAGQLDSAHAWTVLASPVLFGALVGPSGGPSLLPYAWDAYPGERDEVARLLARRDSVIVSGDLHTSMVLDIDVDDPDGEEVTAATELMAPAISSAFPAAFEPFAPLLPELNERVRHIDVANGWLLLDITADEVTAEFRLVDDPADAGSTMTVGRRYRIAPGRPRAVEL